MYVYECRHNVFFGYVGICVLFFSFRFSEIPRQKHPDGAAPTEVTLHNMDLSYTLETFLENNYSEGGCGLSLSSVPYCHACAF